MKLPVVYLGRDGRFFKTFLAGVAGKAHVIFKAINKEKSNHTPGTGSSEKGDPGGRKMISRRNTRRTDLFPYII